MLSSGGRLGAVELCVCTNCRSDLIAFKLLIICLIDQPYARSHLETRDEEATAAACLAA
jgi:hypothetical protein